ncbi:MAG: NmrA family transcriptional regulator [Bradyrhizobium sp.]|nr:MAG: NmrA family transcriptional regulator [Bradyrhizobium sp.]
MKRPKILITAAAGKTGMATSLDLLRQGFPVRAMVRAPDARSERLKTAGAEIVPGSMEDFSDLSRAMSGAQRAYFCPPLEPGTLRRATLFAASAQEARLEAVVLLSQWVSDPVHPAVHSREKWLTSKVFEWIPDVPSVIVNPGFFADNYMAVLEPAAQFGLMAMPLGEGMNAPPSNEDIARVIAAVLADPAPHIGKRYRPTGPKLLSPPEIAAAIGRALNRKVKFQDAPIKLFMKAATALKISPFVIEELSWYLLDYQRNAFGIGAPTDVVARIGGKEPDGFEAIVRRYATASPFARRTIGAKGHALGLLMSTLLARAPDPGDTRRRLALPTLTNAKLAMDSERWLKTVQPGRGEV